MAGDFSQNIPCRPRASLQSAHGRPGAALHIGAAINIPEQFCSDCVAFTLRCKRLDRDLPIASDRKVGPPAISAIPYNPSCRREL
ncbi:hypothetical protein ACCT30_49045, partial [Rhizobium ruizarguesonis]